MEFIKKYLVKDKRDSKYNLLNTIVVLIVYSMYVCIPMYCRADSGIILYNILYYLRLRYIMP